MSSICFATYWETLPPNNPAPTQTQLIHSDPLIHFDSLWFILTHFDSVCFNQIHWVTMIKSVSLWFTDLVWFTLTPSDLLWLTLCCQLLFVRHQFKIAFFSELKQDTQNALKWVQKPLFGEGGSDCHVTTIGIVVTWQLLHYLCCETFLDCLMF